MTALFKMSDLGLLSYYLGIEVEQTARHHPQAERLHQEAAGARRVGRLHAVPIPNG
jgi:hypothetical protein